MNFAAKSIRRPKNFWRGPAPRDVRGRFGVLLVQFAKIKRDSSLFVDAESFLAQSLPTQLPPAEEYQGQWRCANAAAFAKSMQWMLTGKTNAKLKGEALAHAEFALRNCADEKEKTSIQTFIDDLKRRK